MTERYHLIVGAVSPGDEDQLHATEMDFEMDPVDGDVADRIVALVDAIVDRMSDELATPLVVVPECVHLCYGDPCTYALLLSADLHGRLEPQAYRIPGQRFIVETQQRNEA